MKNLIIAVVLAILMVGAFEVGRTHYHPQKHTGRVELVQAYGTSFWFYRPNGEVFQMFLDNPPAIFNLVQHFDDITYTDDNADMRHFIKAQVTKK